jgi:DNA repair protein RadC
MKTPKLKLILRDKTNPQDRPQITNTRDAAAAFRPHFPPGQLQYREFAFAAYFSADNRVLGVQKLSEGGTASSIIDMKVLFAGALLCGAQSLMLCHNHPSGQLKPSKADLTVTKKAKEAGKLLDIEVLDHIIITATSYYSFLENGEI